MKTKKIILVDGNNFFASCEQMANPQLQGKPVCVLSNNDGCVIARSKEAKQLGISMGMPYFMAKKSFPDAIYLSANFSLYHEISMRMMSILQNYTDKLDIYSIDEAFLDITGCDKVFKISYKTLISKIKKEIEEKLGITVSIGLAPTKILAKMANHKAKKSTGLYEIEYKLIKEELDNIPVEEIWGVGKNIARTLKSYGIFYADEILLKDDNFYKTTFGKKGMELKYELSGISVMPVTGIIEKPKSIQKTRAFPDFTKDKEYIKSELAMHLHNVCKKLRNYNLKTNHIAVMLRTKDFRVLYKEEKIDISTNSEIDLTQIVLKLFESIYYKDIIYRSSGVIVINLTEAETPQLSFFTNIEAEKSKKLSSVIDKMEDKFGKGSLAVGKIGIKKIQEKHTRKQLPRTF